MEWEIFCDLYYYYLWCVRPLGDCEFNSPRSFHFAKEEEAQAFKDAVEKEFKGNK